MVSPSVPSYYSIYFVFLILHVLTNVLIAESVENREHFSVLSVVSCLASFFHESFNRTNRPAEAGGGEKMDDATVMGFLRQYPQVVS